MLTIKTLQEAKNVWRCFNDHYLHLMDGFPPDDHFQRFAKGEWPLSNDLISVNLRGDDRSDFMHFVNINETSNPQVKRSLNQVKLERLLMAVRSAQWHAPVFQEKTLPELALSLYYLGEITQHQILSILERHQTIKDYPLIEMHQLLDENGAFSYATQSILLPLLQKQNHLQPLSHKQLDEFNLLLRALPASEQFFYTTQKGKLAQKPFRQLGHILIYLEGILEFSGALVHLSAGARDALGLVRFGLKNYVKPLPRLGWQTRREIEKGVKARVRYAALNFPGTTPYKTIHHFPNVTDLEATSHDVYHANVMSTIPEPFLKALERFIDISRRETGILWSREIWDWVDCDYTYFFLKFGEVPYLNSAIATSRFCEMLAYGNGTRKKSISQGGSLLLGKQPTVLGILIFIDMVKNPKAWGDIGINPTQLTGLFKHYYLLIKRMYANSLVVESEAVLQVLNVQIYLLLEKQHLTAYFPVFNQMIKQNRALLLPQVCFKKMSKEDSLQWRNAIELTVKNLTLSKFKASKLMQHLHHVVHPHLIASYGRYFSQAIFLNYSLPQAQIFAYLRYQGYPEKQALFLAKPTMLNWMEHDHVGQLSATVLLPLVVPYGMVQVYKARRQLAFFKNAADVRNQFGAPEQERNQEKTSSAHVQYSFYADGSHSPSPQAKRAPISVDHVCNRSLR